VFGNLEGRRKRERVCNRSGTTPKKTVIPAPTRRDWKKEKMMGNVRLGDWGIEEG
jgi:hypothetical protein